MRHCFSKIYTYVFVQKVKIKTSLIIHTNKKTMASLSSRTQTLLIWSLFFLLIGNFIINYLWRQQLYNMGLDIISQFQRSKNIALIIFFSIPTLLIEPGLIIGHYFIELIKVKQKSTIINTIVWILLNSFGSCILKAFYADPRPFWSR